MPEKICLRRAAAAAARDSCKNLQTCQFPYIGFGLVMADFLIPLQVTMCISWFWSCHGRIVNSLTTCISWFRLGLVMADFSIPLQHIFDGLGLVMTCHSRLFHSLTTHISWFRSCQFPHNTVANKKREWDSWNTGGCNRHHCLGQCHDW